MTMLQKFLGAPKLNQTVAKMIEEAQSADEGRRTHGRVPYFHPVMIQLDESPELYSAFTRDVSTTGIGLLHWMPIQPQTISVLTKLDDGEEARMLVRVVWCVPCGEGWYISGGRFVGLDPN